METVLYSHMFYAMFQFFTQVKFELLDGNIATEDSSNDAENSALPLYK